MQPWIVRGIIVLALAAPVCVPAAEPYSMADTSLYPISTDKTRNRDYLLYIHLPGDYDRNRKKSYPVLYLLDAWWDFPVVAGAYSGLRFDQLIPEMIIVGIGYAGDDPDVESMRESDYTPPGHPDNSNMGDGKRFLDFIENDVIDWVDRHYRTDRKYRVLAGTSYGGLFTLFALFEKPSLFQGHIAITPAVSWLDRWIFRREAQFYSSGSGGRPPRLDTHLYISVGEKDQLDNFSNETTAFSQLIRNRPYRGFDFRFELKKNERHASVKLASFSQALSHAFSGYPATTRQ